jgi:hypothetical protein
MKKVFFFICISGFLSCQNREETLTKASKDSANYTAIQWVDSLKNIGNVNAGTQTQIKFRFKNVGTKPLFIIAARPGCGCTIADYPKGAISPGAEGVITANYKANKGAEGSFRKNISVTANTKGSTNHNIFFYGEIKNNAARAETAKRRAVNQ